MATSSEYRKAYNEGHEIVPDYVYDTMFDQADAELNDVAQGDLVDHQNPMLSLPTYFFDIENIGIKDFQIAGVQPVEGKITMSFKLDGVPCSCWLGPNGWVQAVSRGKRFKGFVASNKLLSILPKPKRLPEQGIVDIRGEFVIAYEEFKELNAKLPENERYANPRSMVSAQINSLSPNDEIIAKMQWLAHGIWVNHEASDHFEVLPMWLPSTSICPASIYYGGFFTDEELLRKRINAFYNAAMQYKIPCDGIVIQYRKTTENDGKCNLDRIAIKQFDESKFSAISEVTDIEWRLANNGSYFPRLHFAPVIINGSEVTHAAGYCWDYLQRLGLSIGAQVQITMRGGVIPYVSRTLHIGNGDFKMPVDAIEPQQGDMQLWSSNSATAVQRLRFIRGMGMLDLDNCGIELFDDMFEHGFKTLFDVAKQIKTNDFEGTMLSFMPNTEASLAKIRTIEARFKTFNYVWLILALREPGIGFSAANAIGQVLSGYDIRNQARELNKKVIKAFLAKPDIIELVKTYANPVLPEHADLAINANRQVSGKPLAIMSKKPTNGMKKAEFAQAYLQDYDITEDIRQASLLICPEGETSNKIRYAQAHDIAIKHYSDFIR